MTVVPEQDARICVIKYLVALDEHDDARALAERAKCSDPEQFDAALVHIARSMIDLVVQKYRFKNARDLLFGTIDEARKQGLV